MKKWQRDFETRCEEMERDCVKKVKLIYDGRITRYTRRLCRKCGSHGIYLGTYLDCGNLYETAKATYCPHCKTSIVITEICNTHPRKQKKFLKIMKQKMIDSPRHLVSVRRIGKCPDCGETLCWFFKDIGAYDHYYNYWWICPNKKCKWPGRHVEHHRSAAFE